MYSAVTQTDGRVAPRRVMRCDAAVQFEWQSISAPMIPPFSTPSNAS